MVLTENWSTGRRAFPSSTLSTTNPIETDLGWNLMVSGQRPVSCRDGDFCGFPQLLQGHSMTSLPIHTTTASCHVPSSSLFAIILQFFCVKRMFLTSPVNRPEANTWEAGARRQAGSNVSLERGSRTVLGQNTFSCAAGCCRNARWRYELDRREASVARCWEGRTCCCTGSLVGLCQQQTFWRLRLTEGLLLAKTASLVLTSLSSKSCLSFLPYVLVLWIAAALRSTVGTVRHSPTELSNRCAKLFLSSSDPPLFDSPKTYLLVCSRTEASFSAREDRNAAVVTPPLSGLELILKHLTDCRQNVLPLATRRRPSSVLIYCHQEDNYGLYANFWGDCILIPLSVTS